MGSRSNSENKRVVVPVYQKKDGSYGAKSDLQPVRATGVKRDPHAAKKVPKVDVRVDHSILKDGGKYE